MQFINPFQIKEYIRATSLEDVSKLPEIVLAVKMSQSVQAAYLYCAERPRWSNWFDQISRASTSVALNAYQAFGKGRAYLGSDMLIARGEAYEVAAALAIGPREITDPLKPLAKDLIDAINERIQNIKLTKE